MCRTCKVVNSRNLKHQRPREDSRLSTSQTSQVKVLISLALAASSLVELMESLAVCTPLLDPKKSLAVQFRRVVLSILSQVNHFHSLQPEMARANPNLKSTLATAGQDFHQARQLI